MPVTSASRAPDVGVGRDKARQHAVVVVDLDALGIVVAARGVLVAEVGIAGRDVEIAAIALAGGIEAVGRIAVVVDDGEDLAEVAGRTDDVPRPAP